jgi:hypothetical protein
VQVWKRGVGDLVALGVWLRRILRDNNVWVPEMGLRLVSVRRWSRPRGVFQAVRSASTNFRRRSPHSEAKKPAETWMRSE